MVSADLRRLREQLRLKIASTRWTVAPDPGGDVLPSSDGTWSDLDYASRARSGWSPALHLSRVKSLVKTAVADGDRLRIALALRSLGWWCEHDPRSDNWWHNQIGTPRQLASALLLLSDHAPASLIAAAGKILDRSGSFVLNADDSRIPMNWTGANRLWISANRLMAGALTGDEALIGDAMSAVPAEVRVASRHEEGIQADRSFHQHGPLLYNGSYGVSFLEECLFFFEAARGTRWEPDPSYTALLSDFVLDGSRWMLRGADYNHGCLDRVITRPRETNARFAAIGAFLAEVGGPRRAELEDFTRAVRAGMAPGNISGTRMFYRSDFMVRQEPQACVSVRMHSRRTVRAECCNDEGRRSHHVSDGLTYLLRTGEEYRDIFPVWDWQKLPGITCLQTPKPESSSTVKMPATTESVGGVSDGIHGACTQQLFSAHMEARKSWFFGPEGVLCLGAGIRSSFAGAVVTSLDQSLTQGAVETDWTPAALFQGRHVLRKTRWLRHGPWGFVFPHPVDLTVELGGRAGSWDLIGTGPSTPVDRDVFLAYLDHGETPADAGYAYLVIADAERAVLDRIVAQPRFEILANTESMQAVWWPRERLLQAAFFSAGTVSWGDGQSIHVDRDCIVMLRQDDSLAWTLHAADPRQSAESVNVVLREPSRAEKTRAIRFPDGDHLGKTIQVRL